MRSMSIRLRLTLLYSTILAVTLITFSMLLYVTQARATYDSIRSDLQRQAERFSRAERAVSRSGRPRRRTACRPQSPAACPAARCRAGGLKRAASAATSSPAAST